MSHENLKILEFHPKDTCRYRLAAPPALTKPECCDDYFVPQASYTYCPFCGKHIEREPPEHSKESA